MKKTVLKDYSGKPKLELAVILAKEYESLVGMKLSSKVKKVKNTREIFMKRKDIAKILTIIREKELKNG